jgi:hypothetical protein
VANVCYTIVVAYQVPVDGRLVCFNLAVPHLLGRCCWRLQGGCGVVVKTVPGSVKAVLLKMALHWLEKQENEPMGTAGPLALARDILADGSGDPFFVLNRCAA